MIFFKHWENTREKICFCADFKKQYFFVRSFKNRIFLCGLFFVSKKVEKSQLKNFLQIHGGQGFDKKTLRQNLERYGGGGFQDFKRYVILE